MINAAYFTAIILVFMRLLTFFIIVPVFFPKGTPVTFKIGFTIILSYILIPGIAYDFLSNISSIYVFIFYCINEIITGLVLGYITNLCFHSISFAGKLMDMQIGLSMISMFDPNIESSATLIERLLYWTSLVIFFVVDAHHVLIKALIESFKVISLGKLILSEASINLIFKAFNEFFLIGLKIAIPIVLIIILTDLTMGLVARTVPQLNIMILGMPVKILVGIGSFAFVLPMFIKLVETSFQGIPDAMRALFKVIPFIFIFASDEKTEEATPHKKSEARKKGQVAKSKEVGLALTLLASTIVLLTLGEYVGNSLKDTLIAFLNNYMTMSLDEKSLQKLTIVMLWRIGIVVLPVVVPIMVMGIFANYAQVGFIFTKEPLKPDLKKLNPISGFKKIFSKRTIVELLKDIALISVVGYIGFNFVKDNYLSILNTSSLTPAAVMSSLGSLTVSIFFKITIVMIIVALADYIFQRRQYNKELRMTKQEIKEEFKQQEGDPQVKGKIKQKQREMAMSRMMQSVPQATVVVTNPTHYAVALKYDEGEGAPKVVAKGADYVAFKIKEKAKENDVPIIENRPLARLLYSEVDIDSEIPIDMYQTVAEILALVYKLKKKKY